MRVSTGHGLVSLHRQRGARMVERLASYWPLPITQLRADEGGAPADFGISFQVGPMEVECLLYELPPEDAEQADLVLGLLIDAIHEALRALARRRMAGCLLPCAALREEGDEFVPALALFAPAGVLAPAEVQGLVETFLMLLSTSLPGAQLPPFRPRRRVPRLAAGSIRMDFALIDGEPLLLGQTDERGELEPDLVDSLERWAGQGVREVAWAPAVPQALSEAVAARLRAGEAVALGQPKVVDSADEAAAASEDVAGDHVALDAPPADVAAPPAAAEETALVAVHRPAASASLDVTEFVAVGSAEGATDAGADAGADAIEETTLVEVSGPVASAALDATEVVEVGEVASPPAQRDLATATELGDDTPLPAEPETAAAAEPLAAAAAEVLAAAAAEAPALVAAAASASTQPEAATLEPAQAQALVAPYAATPFARLLRIGADACVGEMVAAAIEALARAGVVADAPAALGPITGEIQVMPGFAGVEQLLRAADGTTTALAVRAWAGCDRARLVAAAGRLQGGAARLAVIELLPRPELDLPGWSVLSWAELRPLLAAAAALPAEGAVFASFVAGMDAWAATAAATLAAARGDARALRAPLRDAELLVGIELRLLRAAFDVVLAQLEVHGVTVHAPIPGGAAAAPADEHLLMYDAVVERRPLAEIAIVTPSAGFAVGVRWHRGVLELQGEIVRPELHGHGAPVGAPARRNDYLYALADALGVARSAIGGNPSAPTRALALGRYDLLDGAARGALIERSIETLWVLWERRPRAGGRPLSAPELLDDLAEARR